jgi:hypothetical protein
MKVKWRIDKLRERRKEIEGERMNVLKNWPIVFLLQ